MEHRFYKDSTGWYIDLPYYPFSRSHLAMVGGADTLLEKLSRGKDEIWLKYSSKPFNGHQDFIKISERMGIANGAKYIGGREDLIGNGDNQLWLCPVTLWVFGKYPRKIFYQVLNCSY